MTAPRLSETPDIEAIAEVLAAHRSMISGDVDGWHGVCASCGDLGLNADPEAHVAQALAPVLAAAVREARAAELREAADTVEDECAADRVTCYCSSADWLRQRADRIAVDATRTDQADEATKEDR